MTPLDCYVLCIDCMAHCYTGDTPPARAYQMAGAKLLLGTALHESAVFQYDRQIGYPSMVMGGGWSYWQIEIGSMRDSLKYMRGNKDLLARCSKWLGVSEDWWNVAKTCPVGFLRLVQDWPRLAVLLARLHYMRVTIKPIPMNDESRATYWKKYYNTHLGAGTTERYMEWWAKYGLPTVKQYEKRVTC